jgi:GT2 family glycosyltransferase
MTKTIAVLLTCHNRKAKTLACLQNLFEQALPASILIRIYLVDDGSTDGTSESVRAAYPDVAIIPSDGTLFWSGGMRVAWQHATRIEPDFYLWINDDTCLRLGCLATLFATWKESAVTGREDCIVVASCCDPVTGEHTYGGQLVRGAHPARTTAILPDPRHVKSCDTFEGNCVLVPKAAFKTLGILTRFQHAGSDTDYGLRATRSGVRLVVAPGYLAECSLNPPEDSWQCRDLPRRARWRKLVGRKGLPPQDWWRFLWAHAGVRALLYWPVPYVRVLIGI